MQNATTTMDSLTLITPPAGDVMIPANTEFYEKFNQSDFMFNHGLAHHPMFEPRALGKLACRIPKIRDFVYWQNGRVSANDDWGTTPAPRLTLEETIEGIVHNDSLVVLKHADQDPVYGPLLQGLLQRMFSLLSPASQADIVLGESLIFINSPRRKTPYHVDLESSCLLQITGEKLVHVFGCKDRSVTPHLELENHCAGKHGVIYKPERQPEAHSYRLSAGHGVHFPSLGPHWVENADDVSVSININFDLVSIHHRLRSVYRINRLVRRLGLEPTPPGESAFRDAVKKVASLGTNLVLGSVRKAIKRRDVADSYPVWRPIR